MFRLIVTAALGYLAYRFARREIDGVPEIEAHRPPAKSARPQPTRR